MSKQPKALRLAEALSARVISRWIHSTKQTPRQSGYAADAECVQAAAELRRLHAECEALRADAERYRWLRDPANAYRDEWNYFGPYSSAAEIDAVIDAAREAK